MTVSYVAVRTHATKPNGTSERDVRGTPEMTAVHTPSAEMHKHCWGSERK